jgi:hypothetical protein
VRRCSSLRKPILARNTVGALRYAWLRAPPSHLPTSLKPIGNTLTHKSPYEGGQRRAAPCPPSLDELARNGGHASLCPPYAPIKLSNIFSVSSPAQAGDPVFQRQQCLSRKAAAYWMPRSSRGMTAEDGSQRRQNTRPHSRDSFSPELFNQTVPPENGGRREGRALAAPGGWCAAVVRIERTPGITRFGRNDRPSLRNGVTAYTCSPRRAGLVGRRRPRIARELGPSVGGSGPHDFAVRPDAHRLSAPKRPSHPDPNVRGDSRETPLLWIRMGAG